MEGRKLHLRTPSASVRNRTHIRWLVDIWKLKKDRQGKEIRGLYVLFGLLRFKSLPCTAFFMKRDVTYVSELDWLIPKYVGRIFGRL